MSVNRTTKALLVLLLLTGAQSSRSTQAAPPASGPLTKLLIGHWKLVSFEATSDGATEHPFGPDATGEIRYDPAGHMSVQIMRSGRKPFAAGDQAGGTTDEVAEAFTGYVAYYGSYSVDEEAGTVIHHLSGSMFPNWVGSDQRRKVLMNGDRLILSTPPTLFQGKQRIFRLTWARVE